jgi:hypothetical protein
MKLTRLNLRKPRLRVPIVSSLVGLAVLVFLAATVAFTTGGFSYAATFSVVPRGNFDEVQIQLGANGFTPSDVQHAAGTFAIAVDNTGISGEYTLRLKAADGTVVKEVEVQKGSAAWTITLPAGDYTLTEAGHSDWSCRITLQ